MMEAVTDRDYYVLYWDRSNRDKYTVKYCETLREKDRFCRECEDKQMFYLVAQRLRSVDEYSTEFYVSGEGEYPKVKKTLLALAVFIVGATCLLFYYLLTKIN